MRDYEQTIRELRDSQYVYHYSRDYLKNMMDDAADAIEELVSNADKFTWVSVDEKLPESGVHVLVACRVKYGGRSYVCDAFYAAPKSISCGYNDDIDAVYDEEKDEYYFPEGWWEVVKNWDDYSCVAIFDTVTHWQPLPEPPKEM